MQMRQLATGILAGVLVLSTGLASAQAATYTQKKNAITQYSGKSLRTVNNRAAQFVSAPSDYAFSGNPTGQNTIKSTGGNRAWTLTTKYLLPNTRLGLGNKNYDVTNPQSAAMSGKYLYVIYSPHAVPGMTNKGFVVRYSLSKLNSMNFGQMQSALNNGKVSGIKVGPIFTIGHGQSLAYNPKHHTLWMWRDTSMTSAKSATLQKISSKTLKPTSVVNFHMTDYGSQVAGGHELTFDNRGNGYYWTVSGGKIKIYKGTIGAKKVHFRLTKQLLQKNIGTHEQSIAYNAHNGRLYLIADDSILTLPAKKLNGKGSLKSKDFKYTRFNSRREFEGMVFDNQGHGMLLSNRTPELLRSTSAY